MPLAKRYPGNHRWGGHGFLGHHRYLHINGLPNHGVHNLGDEP